MLLNCSGVTTAVAFALLACSQAGSATGALPIGTSRESNDKLSRPEFLALAHNCAPHVSPVIMEGIATTESALHPYALSINYPATKARQNGYAGKVIMVRQPRNKSAAIHWAKWYLSKGYTVSVGLVQVNVEMAHKLGIPQMALFEPCINLAAGAKILSEDYAAALRDGYGLMQAFSLYNSGSSTYGVDSGYASTVVRNANR